MRVYDWRWPSADRPRLRAHRLVCRGQSVSVLEKSSFGTTIHLLSGKWKLGHLSTIRPEIYDVDHRR